jgi:hypothetical protein
MLCTITCANSISSPLLDLNPVMEAGGLRKPHKPLGAGPDGSLHLKPLSDPVVVNGELDGAFETISMSFV